MANLSVSTKEQELPDKVTLTWLMQHVPVSFWLWLGGILITTIIIGVTLGQTSFAKELLGKRGSETSTPATLTSEELKDRINRLIEGNNNSTRLIYEAIVEEEKKAGTSVYSSEQEPHIQAADRLRITLKQENQTFQAKVNALKSLREQSN